MNKSAITRLSQRDEDWYPTPDNVTEVLFDRVPWIDGTVLELCAGDCRMAKVIRRRLTEKAASDPGKDRTVYTNDISLRRPTDFHFDATDELAMSCKLPRCSWIITNPPYNAANAILPMALKYSTVGMAMLLRLSYFEPTDKRADWLAANPPTGILFTPRISFKTVVTQMADGKVRTSKTDNMSTFWGIWTKEPMPQWHAVITKEELKRCQRPKALLARNGAPVLPTRRIT